MKIQDASKYQRRIRNPAKHLRQRVYKNSKRLKAINCFRKTLHLRNVPFNVYQIITYVCVSAGKKCQFFGNICVRTTKWLIRYIHVLFYSCCCRIKQTAKLMRNKGLKYVTQGIKIELFQYKNNYFLFSNSGAAAADVYLSFYILWFRTINLVNQERFPNIF